MIFRQPTEITEIFGERLANSPLGRHSEANTLDRPMAEYDKPLAMIDENFKNCPREGGQWEEDRGDSIWHPDPSYIPGKANPNNETWGSILEKYEIDGIAFKEGEPDFSEISKGTVEISPFTDSRTDNFDKADIELAKQRGCTPEEVSKWRKENGYTWHECKDMKTMQKVPSQVHNNISHSGGISAAKKGNGEQTC